MTGSKQKPAGRHHHGQPKRLGDHAPRRRNAGAVRHPARGQDRVRPPYGPTAWSQYAKSAKAQGVEGDRRRRRRRGPPARHGGGDDGPCPCWACRSNPRALSGLDSLLSIVQMPGGVPVGTLAIGVPGAKNAGILAASIVALQRCEIGGRETRSLPSARRPTRSPKALYRNHSMNQHSRLKRPVGNPFPPAARSVF